MTTNQTDDVREKIKRFIGNAIEKGIMQEHALLHPDVTKDMVAESFTDSFVEIITSAKEEGYAAGAREALEELKSYKFIGEFDDEYVSVQYIDKALSDLHPKISDLDPVIAGVDFSGSLEALDGLGIRKED